MITRVLIGLIRAYQVVISPWLGVRCRFVPSCSQYALACLQSHGPWRGGLLSLRRLARCHPFHPGGHDPPPPPPLPCTLLPGASGEAKPEATYSTRFSVDTRM